MVPRDEYRLVIPTVVWVCAVATEAGSVTSWSPRVSRPVLLLLRPPSTKTEFVISSGLAGDEKQTSRWCYVLGIRRLARRSYATEDDFHLLITSGNGARAMGSTKSM
jgi:hypothetical protein